MCVVAAALVVLLVLAALSLALGDVRIPVRDLPAALSGRSVPADPADRAEGAGRVATLVVAELRLPRLVTGVLAGAALGLAGALTLTLTGNDLGSPDVLGVTAGAGVAATATLVLLGGTSSGADPALHLLGVPAAATAGALLTAALVWALARRGGADGQRLLLVGVGIGAACTSATSFLLVKASVLDASRATAWLTGSLNGRGWEHAVALAVVLPLAVAAVMLGARQLRVLQLGESTAVALGVRIRPVRAGVLLVAVLLTAAGVAGAGPVAFVSLLAPHAARRLAAAAVPPPLVSAAVGATLLVGADLLARTGLPVELPVGVVTAALGAPVLLVLLIAAARKVS